MNCALWTGLQHVHCGFWWTGRSVNCWLWTVKWNCGMDCDFRLGTWLWCVDCELSTTDFRKSYLDCGFNWEWLVNYRSWAAKFRLKNIACGLGTGLWFIDWLRSVDYRWIVDCKLHSVGYSRSCVMLKNLFGSGRVRSGAKLLYQVVKPSGLLVIITLKIPKRALQIYVFTHM